MFKKETIKTYAIVILSGLAVFLIGSDILESMQKDAFSDAQTKILGTIITSVNQSGSVNITIPDGDGGNKTLTLVAKGESDMGAEIKVNRK
tara:strand:+ start:589 stop:861 length:273 start_codon:yes stop_codon:yes gene_type:complete